MTQTPVDAPYHICLPMSISPGPQPQASLEKIAFLWERALKNNRSTDSNLNRFKQRGSVPDFKAMLGDSLTDYACEKCFLSV